MDFVDYNHVLDFLSQCEKGVCDLYRDIDKIVLYNQNKVLNAFKKARVALTDFAGSSGYGYDDRGKNKLGDIVADIFGAESALVSPNFTCGTHALSCTLFGLLRPGDLMLSISGEPYDTLKEVIGGNDIGSLKDMGIKYAQVDLKDGKFDVSSITSKIKALKPKLIFIQRSRGYQDRDAFSIEQLKDIIDEIHNINKKCIIMVDNCYGEFIETKEPTEVGADIAVGSLIKNMGGGLAPTGGYVAGRAELVDKVARHLTAPTLGSEVGSYKSGYSEFFEGIFMAPHVVGGVLKGVLLMSSALTKLGYKTNPKPDAIPKDIICMIELGTEEKLIAFCKTIQENSPVDSFLSPEPWDMPGYTSKVIMAAGTFIQGASIELSCDGPVKPPYRLYLQGGLTYEHIKIALANALLKL